jgi:hypothetical protein
LRFSYQRQSTSYFVGDIGDALLSKMKSWIKPNRISMKEYSAFWIEWRTNPFLTRN